MDDTFTIILVTLVAGSFFLALPIGIYAYETKRIGYNMFDNIETNTNKSILNNNYISTSNRDKNNDDYIMRVESFDSMNENEYNGGKIKKKTKNQKLIKKTKITRKYKPLRK